MKFLEVKSLKPSYALGWSFLPSITSCFSMTSPSPFQSSIVSSRSIWFIHFSSTRATANASTLFRDVSVFSVTNDDRRPVVSNTEKSLPYTIVSDTIVSGSLSASLAVIFVRYYFSKPNKTKNYAIPLFFPSNGQEPNVHL